MSTLKEIRSEIKKITESVTEIGKVYDQAIIATTDDKYKEAFGDEDGRINTLWFTQFHRKVIDAEGWKVETRERKWIFFFYFGYNNDEDSDLECDEILEKLCDKFNENETLNNKVNAHSKIDLITKIPAKLGNTLVHLCRLEMTTYDLTKI